MAKLQSRQKAALTASYAESGLLQPRLNLVVQRLGLLALRNRPEHLQRLLRQYFEAIGQIQFGTGEELRFVRQALRGRQQEDVANYIGYSFRRMGNYDQSKVWYEKALASDPNHVRTWSYYRSEEHTS